MSSNPFVGAWRLVTFEFLKEDGSLIYPFGAEAQGSIIYTESGRYSAQLMRKDRLKLKAGDQMKGTVEEVESNYKGCISYFGTYEVDLDVNLIVHHVEGSIFPNMEGTNQLRSFEFSEKRLQLRTPPMMLDGEKAFGILLWERIE
jgi:hypothetical protein